MQRSGLLRDIRLYKSAFSLTVSVCIYSPPQARGDSAPQTGFGEKQEKHHAGIIDVYTVLLKHTQGNTRLQKRGMSCIISFRYGMESRCVGGHVACAGYGELQLPIAAVLILFFPKSTIYSFYGIQKWMLLL